MHIQKSNSEGSIPIAYIRCKIDSNGIVEHITSANNEASSLIGYDIDRHLEKPILDLYPYFSKRLPWHPIFLLPSTHTLPYTKEFLATHSEEYYSVTVMECSAKDEVVFLIRDISFENYLTSLHKDITKTKFDILLFLDDEFTMQNIITSNDKEYLIRPREEIIGFSMRDVFGNEFAISMEELALLSKKDGHKKSIIFHFPEMPDSRRFKVVAESITTNNRFSYSLSFKDITSDIDLSSSLFDSIKGGIIVHDDYGIVQSVNKQLLEMTGFGNDEVVGKHITSILSEFDQKTEYETLLLNKKEQLFRVSVSSTSIALNCKEHRVVTVVTNITKVRALNRSIKRKALFADIFFDLSRTIFTSNQLNFDVMVDHALKVLGEFSGADRAYIFLYREGETMDNTHEWCAANIICEKENLQQLPKDIFPNWMYRLSKGKEIYVDRTERLSDEWIGEREILLAQSVKSVLVHPIIGQENNFGFIGFDAVQSSMSWNKDERNLLRFFANTLGEVLARNSNEKEINMLREKTKALVLETELMNNEFNSFFAKISHEIRDSINSIIGINSMLFDTKLDPNQLRLANIIKSSSDFLINLIRDVLDYSKINTSAVTLNKNSFSLARTIEHVIESIEQKALHKGLYLSFNHDKKIPSPVSGDPIKISQIVTNLLSNAIKYSDKGEIVISTKLESLSQKDIIVSICVADPGIGIKKEHLEKIFDSYYQVKETRSQQYESTGLGLPIVKWLTEAMGGSVEVQSTFNKGSLFCVTLPLQIETKSILSKTLDESWKNTPSLIINGNSKRAHEIASILRGFQIEVDIISSMEEFQKIQELIEEGNYPYTLCLIDNSMLNNIVYQQLVHCKKDSTHENHLIFITSETPISSSLFLHEDEEIIDSYFIYPIDPNQLIDEIHSKMKNVRKKKRTNYNEFKVLSPLKILVVEDIEINQEIMLYQLGQVGIQCEAVSNGHAAIEKVKQSIYDVILLDIRMPGIDGYETTRLIRALPDVEQRNIPIVAMTANVSMGEREKCLLAGMDDYLSKPIKADELYGTLLQFLPNDIIIPQKENRYKIHSNNPRKTPLKGIDIDTAFSLLDNDKELFTHLLNQFFIEYHDFTNLYNNTANDNSERTRFIHSIKSISANLGATKLSHLAATLEKLVSQVPYEDYALAQHEFMNEFSLVIDSIKHSEYFEKPKERNHLDSISLSIQEIISLLNMLKKRLHGGRNKEINESMEMLLSISFEGLVHEKVTTLQNFIRLYNYNKAIHQVDEIIHLLSQQGL